MQGMHTDLRSGATVGAPVDSSIDAAGQCGPGLAPIARSVGHIGNLCLDQIETGFPTDSDDDNRRLPERPSNATNDGTIGKDQQMFLPPAAPSSPRW